MEETMAHDGSDSARVREDLRWCRETLAALQSEKETWAEEIARLQHSHNLFVEVSQRLDAWLTSLESATPSGGNGVRARVQRRFITHMPSAREVEQVARLRASALFDGAWYIREYPKVVGTGLSPALHYLRRGAKNGRNPGPDFDTASYVKRHPSMRRRANPLLHYLDSLGAGPAPVTRR